MIPWATLCRAPEPQITNAYRNGYAIPRGHPCWPVWEKWARRSRLAWRWWRGRPCLCQGGSTSWYLIEGHFSTPKHSRRASARSSLSPLGWPQRLDMPRQLVPGISDLMPLHRIGRSLSLFSRGKRCLPKTGYAIVLHQTLAVGHRRSYMRW